MMTSVTELRVRPVDPRDQSWELWNPRFRVYFWRSLGDDACMSREFELDGGDVGAALAWAAEQAVDQEIYTVYCVVEGTAGIGLVRLTGDDPTRN